MATPVREKGSRTQSTTPHKKCRRRHRLYNKAFIHRGGNYSADGITPSYAQRTATNGLVHTARYLYNTPIIRIGRIDGITLHLYKDVGSSVKAAEHSSCFNFVYAPATRGQVASTSSMPPLRGGKLLQRYAGASCFNATRISNKNTTPKRGVVSATYPNDTSAARCIGRRRRDTIHMSSPRQVCISPYW